jgi:adenylate kinase family enzyme
LVIERAVILGPAGAGKTTLAEGIARRTGLPLVHLDLLFWREGGHQRQRKRLAASSWRRSSVITGFSTATSFPTTTARRMLASLEPIP